MTVDHILAPVYIAAVLNTLLFGIEIVQAWNYFKKYFAGDRMFVRLAVVFALFFDLVCTAAEHVLVYEEAIGHWGDYPYVQTLDWPFIVYTICTGIGTSIVQVFMILRFWTLSRNQIVCAFLSILFLLRFGTCIYSLYIFFTFVLQGLVHRKPFLIGAILWLTLNAIMDSAVAISLVVHLFKQDAVLQSTKRLVRNLVAMILKSGSVTALWVTAAFIAFICDVDGNATMIFGFSIGRIYSLTMLYNLNTRSHLRKQVGTVVNDLSFHLSTSETNENGNVSLGSVADMEYARRYPPSLTTTDATASSDSGPISPADSIGPSIKRKSLTIV